ncbi:MAG: hypothetical protein E7641_04060 [Ruminococcaceae bacterium]|nr:hypothetical protein [Oscillospiraceae bacterium]
MTAPASIKERIKVFFTTPRNIFEIIISPVFLILSFGTLLYYVTGPALGYFHSDCSDSLLWAQVMIESGNILSEDFAYAAILPFGSPLWMVPILKIFGYTMKAQILSMCVFTVIFILSALSLFRAMKWRYSVSSGATFCLVMLLSASVKLREIMWEHVIYYSLGILFTMLLLNLVFRLYDKLSDFPRMKLSDIIKAAIYALLLTLLCAGIATDGFQLIGLTVVPVAAAIVAYTLFQTDNIISKPTLKRYAICAFMAIGTVIGIVMLNKLTNDGAITAGYADAYSKWAPMSAWVDNALLFPSRYLSLFGIEIDVSEELFSGNSIMLIISIITALIILVLPFVLFARYKHLDKYSKVVAWTHLVLTVVIMLGFICGGLANANWRLTPFLGSSIIASLVFIKHLLGNKGACRRVAVLLSLLLIFASLQNAKVIKEMDKDFGKEDSLQKVADTLAEKGYTRGYATFWNAAETALRSDGAVDVITVEISGDVVMKRRYQTMSYWFDDVEGQKDYFLLLDMTEYDDLFNMGEFRDSLPKDVKIIEEIECAEYIIVVFNKNIF